MTPGNTPGTPDKERVLESAIICKSLVHVGIDFSSTSRVADWLRFGGTKWHVWTQLSITKTLPADPVDRVGFSKYIFGGRVVYKDVIKFYYDQTNKMFGTNYKPPK